MTTHLISSVLGGEDTPLSICKTTVHGRPSWFERMPTESDRAMVSDDLWGESLELSVDTDTPARTPMRLSLSGPSPGHRRSTTSYPPSDPSGGAVVSPLALTAGQHGL